MSETLLHGLLERSARRHGEGTALVDGTRALTYAALDEHANRLAHLLRGHGVHPGDRVGLFLDKSMQALVGVYGILKAGGIYVPLDPQAPLARAAYIARNADLRVLVTGKEKMSSWGGLVSHQTPVETLVALNTSQEELADSVKELRVLPAEALDDYPSSSPSVKRDSSDLAYILYTSGSTGEPKGVMLSHRNALAFVDWAVAEIQVTASDRLSSHAPLHFDLSIFDLYAAAKAGAAVILVPPALSVFPFRLATFIRDTRISIWYSVPSALSMLVLRGRLDKVHLGALRTLLYAGEVFPTKYLFQLMKVLPGVRIYNLYGPTETNVCTWYELPPPEECPDEIPIGRAIADVEVYVAAEDGRRVVQGEVGELYVRGPTVMQGYWGDPERTARSLIAEPGEGWPTYRTGDLVKEAPDGNHVFLGRRDSQIKSRGYRIELGEIEAALYSHPAVVECAVAAIPDQLVTNRIKAYVVARDELDAEGLAKYCEARLPGYMVPETFDFRRELPKSSTGKIARTALESSPPLSAPTP
jgi:L-proline---[L-prolyl-carrier protein] ligase